MKNKSTSMIINDHQGVYDLLKDLKSWEYIDTLGFTVADIEKKYQSMNLDVVGKKKNSYIENDLHIAPSMVGYFYYFLYQYGRIPTQIEYIKFYYVANKKWVMEHMLTEHMHLAFFGRLSRFYPSMLRDIHFYHLLKESGKFENVLFSLKQDLEAKIDVLVQKRGKWYGIQLRTKTRRSNQFYEKKKHRNPIHTDATLVDLPIDLSEARELPTKKDSIKLYGQEHVEYIIEYIREIDLELVMREYAK